MSDEKWGVGKGKDAKPFDKVRVGTEEMDLIYGEFPHSRQDNCFYVRDKDGNVTGFDGHRRAFKIEIEESNYMKSSNLSGDEVRKSCSGKLWVNGVQCYDTFHRNYDACYKNIQKFISDMEMMWSWFPFNLKEWEGKTIGYREQLFKIDHIIVDQACLILKTTDGNPRKKFLWEERDDFEDDDFVKVEITSEAITWYPKIENIQPIDSKLN